MHMISLSYLSCIGLPHAAYFHLYGIERDDVDYIMGTFRVMKQALFPFQHKQRMADHRTLKLLK